MNLQFFGDSYDIIKRSFISWLSDFGRWSVHPMFTHEVDAEAAGAFARFLNARLLSSDPITVSTDRQAYFECCLSAGNLFLDPDTGVSLAARTGAKSIRYIFGPELLRLVLARPHRLTLVFDQSFARGVRERVEGDVRKKLAALAAGGAYGFAYVSHAPFLCLAADPSLVLRAHEAVKANSSLPPTRLIA
jgi:hypothetical protein